MNNQETQGTTNEIDPASVHRVVMLAQECPSDYPNGSFELRDVKEFVDLSKALAEAGFPFLAKAVLGGIAWSRKIANGHSLRDEEKHASYPGWTWNRSA
jgi:hypothetical protein